MPSVPGTIQTSPPVKPTPEPSPGRIRAFHVCYIYEHGGQLIAGRRKCKVVGSMGPGVVPEWERLISVAVQRSVTVVGAIEIEEW